MKLPPFGFVYSKNDGMTAAAAKEAAAIFVQLPMRSMQKSLKCGHWSATALN